MRDLIGTNLVRGIGVGVEMETPNLEKDIDANISDLVAKLKGTVDYETAKTSAMVAGNNYINNYYKQEINDDKKDSRSKVIHTTLNVDGRVLAEATSPYMDIELGNIQNRKERGGC